jgi:hypothetical protein
VTRYCLAMLLLCPFASVGADAQEPLSDRYSMSIGAYSVDARTSARVDAAGGKIGTSFSFEDDLGIDPDAWARDFGFTARVGERHRFELERFAFERSGERSNTRQITIRDDVYDVGLVLETSFDTDVTRLSYSYLFARDNNHEVGVAVGVHVTDFSMGVRVAFLPLTSATEESAGTTAPLPVVGAHGAYRPFPRWIFRGQAQIFRLEAGGYDGALNHVALEMEHNTFHHLGFGVALDYFEVDLDSTEPKFVGAFNLTFSGPRVFMRGHF